MTIKELIQAEINKIPEEKLKEVYGLIKQFNYNGEKNKPPYHDLDDLAGTWSEEKETEFIANTKQFNEIESQIWQ